MFAFWVGYFALVDGFAFDLGGLFAIGGLLILVVLI